MSVKKDLKKERMQDIGLSGNQPIFINTNLCPNTKCFGQNVRGFMSQVILRTYTFLGVQLKIKITENSSPIAITHAQDSTKYLPKVDDLLPTSL